MTPRRDRADERRAMLVFAIARGIPFEIRPSMFMPGHVAYLVGEGKARRIVHSPDRAWKALRAAASRPSSPRRCARP